MTIPSRSTPPPALSSHPGHRPALLLVVLCCACSIFSLSSAGEPAGDPTSAPAVEAAPGDEAVATVRCPEGLGVDASARTIDTRQHGTTPWQVYEKRKWSSNHRKPAPTSFGLAAADAVDRFLALEAEHLDGVPEPYRKRVQAQPRDVELRLEMATCELTEPSTRRRASYDAALALLLGADPEVAGPIMLESTKRGAGSDSMKSCDEESSCGDDRICDIEAGWCLTPMALAITYIDEHEVDMEDALSRGLHALSREPPSDDGIEWWNFTRVHRCIGAPKRLCSFRAYNKDGKTTVVEWDQRDGGTVKVTKVKMTKAERAIYNAKVKCWEATGSHTRSQCRHMCHAYQRGPECDVECIAHCSR